MPVAAPTPAPAPLAKPAAPPPAIAAPSPTVAKPAPVVAPSAPARREVAIAAPSSASAAVRLDAKAVEQIFSCLAPGLPAEWRRAWVEVSNAGGTPTGKFYFTTSLRREDGEEFTPCSAPEVARRIASLSDASSAGGRNWRLARLSISSDGDYEFTVER